MTMNPDRTQQVETVDAVVVGAGFCGLFATWRLTQFGLSVQAFDSGADVGGVWFRNRYPGAQTDSPQHTYQFTMDEELLNEEHYSMKFPPQPEVLGYLRKFADRFGVRRAYRFETVVRSATFDDGAGEWEVRTDRGDVVRARHLVTGVGLVSDPVRPKIPGLDGFRGRVLFTSAWPAEDPGIEGRRVGLIGTGSSGIQITSTLAAAASHLTVFQRTPNYVVPTGNRPVDEADRAEVRERYADVARRVAAHPANFPFEQRTGRLAREVSPEDRAAVFEEMWVRGGFSLLYESFDDVAVDPVANGYLCDFVRGKIREIVEDPETARLLSPDYPYGAKRPPTGDGYYQAFNSPTVDLVSVRETPILEITETGIRTAAGDVELDVIVFATGFDAVTGAFDRMDVTGRDGRSLREHWADGPSTYLGIGVHGFPNFYMVAGPQSPFSNLPPGAELEGGWIADLIAHQRASGALLAEPTADAEDGWNRLVNEIAEGSFSLRAAADANSWFTGANVAGKARAYNIFFGGADAYAAHLGTEAAAGYPNYAFGATAAELSASRETSSALG